MLNPVKTASTYTGAHQMKTDINIAYDMKQLATTLCSVVDRYSLATIW